MKRRIKTNHGVSAFIYDQGKFLLLRETGSDWWLLPGGRVEKGEFLLPALRREIFEETGLKKVKIVGPLNYWQGLHDGKPREGVAFMALYQGGKIKLSFEHDSYAWMDISEIKKRKTSHAYKYFVIAKRIIRSKLVQDLINLHSHF
ncbi:MAG: NUDIX domain-containing protein [Candidatus Parcubacteria bacterium]|nr:NUDIX domain-containing protein [Candidatus Parcubacteria bacterium]